MSWTDSLPLEEYLGSCARNRGALERLSGGARSKSAVLHAVCEWIPDPEALVRNCLWRCLGANAWAAPCGWLPAGNFGTRRSFRRSFAGSALTAFCSCAACPILKRISRTSSRWRGRTGPPCAPPTSGTAIPASTERALKTSRRTSCPSSAPRRITTITFPTNTTWRDGHRDPDRHARE
jgi:hypothetical protein